MPIYQMTKNSLAPLEKTTFQREEYQERRDLQPKIRDQIEILDPELLVIGEEFGEFEGSNRRIDTLRLTKMQMSS